MSQVATGAALFAGASRPWPERLEFVLETMRELSSQTDPQRMVGAYSARMRQVMPSDRHLSLSRRNLAVPQYRITRSSTWEHAVNPWKSPGRLPLFDRGLLGRLIYGDEPVVVDDLQQVLEASDPAADYLTGMGSLVAVPLFDDGTALNMVVMMRKETNGFHREGLPEHVWMANLFGRATQTLRFSEELRAAYDLVDRELTAVAEIQRSLLPMDLPTIPTLELAAHYQTSHRAGGDYYDFFPLPHGQWGMLIADVSGHGTPAAVLMAVTHSIAHTFADPHTPPSRLLRFVNDRLVASYTGNGNFVTAFYGIYDPAHRRLTFSNAGHPPPRVRRGCGTPMEAIGGALGLPLGIESGEPYEDGQTTLLRGDSLLLYTDGITEARAPSGDFFGYDGLDAVLRRCDRSAAETVGDILAAVDAFTAGAAAGDDRTLVAARMS